MTSKTINTPRLLVLFIGIVFALIPAVSASHESAASSGNEAIKPADGINYNVLSAGGSSLDDGNSRIYPLSTMSIATGVTRRTSLPISSKVKSIEVDLKWPGSSNSLSLKIEAPKGVIVGTFVDGSDGKTDQRIHLFIYAPYGATYVTQGTWIFTVRGDSVGGTINFTTIFYTR